MRSSHQLIKNWRSPTFSNIASIANAIDTGFPGRAHSKRWDYKERCSSHQIRGGREPVKDADAEGKDYAEDAEDADGPADKESDVR